MFLLVTGVRRVFAQSTREDATSACVVPKGHTVTTWCLKELVRAHLGSDVADGS